MKRYLPVERIFIPRILYPLMVKRIDLMQTVKNLLLLSKFYILVTKVNLSQSNYRTYVVMVGFQNQIPMKDISLGKVMFFRTFVSMFQLPFIIDLTLFNVKYVSFALWCVFLLRLNFFCLLRHMWLMPPDFVPQNNLGLSRKATGS